MRRAVVLLLVLLLPAVAAPSVSAQATNAPPGLSAVDQYLETVPEDGGSTSSSAKGSPSGSSPGSQSGSPGPAGRPGAPSAIIPRTTERALERSGADGKAAAALAASAAPSDTEAKPPTEKSMAGPSSDPGGVAATIGKAVTGTEDGGSGVLVPLILLLIVLGGLMLGVMRRRRGGAPA